MAQDDPSVQIRVPPEDADDDDVIEWVETGNLDRRLLRRDSAKITVNDYDLQVLDDYPADSPEVQVARAQIALDLAELRDPTGYRSPDVNEEGKEVARATEPTLTSLQSRLEDLLRRWRELAVAVDTAGQ
jgi:hypothetical protein